MADNKKKKKHTGRNVTIGIVAALLLAFGGWYGFGGGNGIGFGASGEAKTGNETAGVTEQNEDNIPAENDSVMNIVVSESAVTVNGTEVASGEIEAFLKDNYAEGVKVTVKDNSAIKATYDEVISALNKLDIPFEIS